MLHHSKKPEAESLRDRLIQAASRLFTAEGYQGLSMRRVAQEAGCSQMAMYRHFANKEALVQYLCGDLYRQFAGRIHAGIATEPDVRKKLNKFIRSVLGFAEKYPDHYTLIFLVRHSDPVVVAMREQLGQQFLEGNAAMVRDALPAGTSSRHVKATLRRMMEALHGAAALWLAHPGAYGLTRHRVIEDVDAIWTALLNRSCDPTLQTVD